MKEQENLDEGKNPRTFIIKDEFGVWKYWLNYHYDDTTFIEAVKRVDKHPNNDIDYEAYLNRYNYFNYQEYENLKKYKS